MSLSVDAQHIYPSSKFQAFYDSNTPEIFAIVVAAVFGIVALSFFLFDLFVQKRNRKIIKNAARSNGMCGKFGGCSLVESFLILLINGRLSLIPKSNCWVHVSWNTP